MTAHPGVTEGDSGSRPPGPRRDPQPSPHRLWPRVDGRLPRAPAGRLRSLGVRCEAGAGTLRHWEAGQVPKPPVWENCSHGSVTPTQIFRSPQKACVWLTEPAGLGKGGGSEWAAAQGGLLAEVRPLGPGAQTRRREARGRCSISPKFLPRSEHPTRQSSNHSRRQSLSQMSLTLLFAAKGQKRSDCGPSLSIPWQSFLRAA